MLKTIVYIFFGGGIGSVLRFLISVYAPQPSSLNGFPLPTFLANIIGCFCIGFFVSYFMKSDALMKYFFITGFCGGFTTFSTFSYENYQLWQSGNYSMLGLYVIGSILLGMGAVFLGLNCNEG